MLPAMFGIIYVTSNEILSTPYHVAVYLETSIMTGTNFIAAIPENCTEMCSVQITGIPENLECYVRLRVHEDIRAIKEEEMFGTNCVTGIPGTPRGSLELTYSSRGLSEIFSNLPSRGYSFIETCMLFSCLSSQNLCDI